MKQRRREDYHLQRDMKTGQKSNGSESCLQMRQSFKKKEGEREEDNGLEGKEEQLKHSSLKIFIIIFLILFNSMYGPASPPLVLVIATFTMSPSMPNRL